MKQTIIILFILFTQNVNAEFTENSFRCYDKREKLAFTIGEFIGRNGYGNIVRIDDRTDFVSSFALKLIEIDAFGKRDFGPYYIGHKNRYYEDNGHRTLLVASGMRAKYLLVFKPKNNGIFLESWRWKSKLKRYNNHSVLPGDKLAFHGFFKCD